MYKHEGRGKQRAKSRGTSLHLLDGGIMPLDEVAGKRQ